jgi:hypothetical protein
MLYHMGCPNMNLEATKAIEKIGIRYGGSPKPT